MPSTTFTLRVDATVKKRLEKLAKNTGALLDRLTHHVLANERRQLQAQSEQAPLTPG